MDDRFDAYFKRLLETPLDQHTEHTGRSALEALLNTFAAEAESKGIRVQHEPPRAAARGAPDFKITQRGMMLGYVEVKRFDANLDQVRRSDQIKRYRELSDNILLTNYREFMWIGAEGVRGHETLLHQHELEARAPRVPPERARAVAGLITHFFSSAPQGIGRSQQLALALAARSRLLREALSRELIRQDAEDQKGRLFGLLTVFREQVFHELSIAEFADAFAQMLAYGLFLARLNTAEGEEITLENARRHISGSFRLIRELVDFLEVLDAEEYDDMRWIVDEVLSIVNGLDLAAIHDDLSFRQRRAISRKVRAKDEEEHRLFERDPFIYFYEDYLRAYDPAMSKGRGVYYTPPPVVNFIVRAVDDLLTGEFGIADGLADHQRVTVLDFACGTGTFLLEVFQRIFENIGGPEAGRADLLVRRHITRNLYGFEYLIAPYTIAHLKLSQYLRDKGHPLRQNERLQVYLTNTLEPVQPQQNWLLPAMTEEVKGAQDVKDMPILVILGNPPYSGHSKNKGDWIRDAINGYKYTIETNESGNEYKKSLGERNPKWLNDDYVKFIRFAQLKMDEVEEGVVGVITNHSWLDNPTFRGMRQSLMRTFDQIYVLDLHGSVKRKETTPDGERDENVFDIEQGVAISLFVKRDGLERGVWRGDLWGTRLEKYRAAAEGSFTSMLWTRLQPTGDFWLFAPQDDNVRAEFEAGWRLPDVFPVNVLGFQTHRDRFAISFTEIEMKQKLAELADPAVGDDELAQRYGLKSNRDWSFPGARRAAREGAATPPRLVAYRPFDDRWSEFSGLTMDYPRRELLDHVAGRRNLTLLAPRGVGTAVWQHAFVVDKPANDCVISNRSREANQVFPLWCYGANDRASENLSPTFRAFLDARYGHHYSPEEVLGYIYAVLHSPTYRSRFAEFLRIDFPHIPFPERAEDFETLSALGWALVEADLLRTVPKRGLADYHGKGSHDVEAVRYVAKEEAVWINQTQRFAPVPPEVWEFRIGGYQVLDKYLKSRRGRTLSLDEINHVARVADALAFTVEQMAKIDAAYRAAFPDQA